AITGTTSIGFAAIRFASNTSTIWTWAVGSRASIRWSAMAWAAAPSGWGGRLQVADFRPHVLRVHLRRRHQDVQPRAAPRRPRVEERLRVRARIARHERSERYDRREESLEVRRRFAQRPPAGTARPD